MGGEVKGTVGGGGGKSTSLAFWVLSHFSALCEMFQSLFEFSGLKDLLALSQRSRNSSSEIKGSHSNARKWKDIAPRAPPPPFKTDPSSQNEPPVLGAQLIRDIFFIWKETVYKVKANGGISRDLQNICRFERFSRVLVRYDPPQFLETKRNWDNSSYVSCGWNRASADSNFGTVVFAFCFCMCWHVPFPGCSHVFPFWLLYSFVFQRFPLFGGLSLSRKL